MFRKTHFLFFVLLLTTAGMQVKAQDFTHPGVLHKESDLARMREKIAQKAEPWYTAWNNLRASSEAQLGWTARATETVIRGGTGDNISIMYRDVAAAYAHALIYSITGDTRHGDKAAEILNAWARINKAVSGNADRYLAAGLNGYQFANAAELMRDYPAFDLKRFQQYMLQVFYYPMNERFLLGNSYGAPHNDACATNYRVNWDACNMNAMLAISILCDNRSNFNKAINYFKNGDGTGNINRAVNFIHSDIWGQWEESGRDQGHAMGGLMLYALFCEIAWNQGEDMYAYGDNRFRKGAEYVARYNIMDGSAGKYNDLPYTSYSRQMGSNCSWYTEPTLSSAVRGKYGPNWEVIYNHYGRRMGQADKVQSIYEILQQQPSTSVPSMAAHPDTYDHPAVGALTFRTDSGSSVYPWDQMNVMPRNIFLQANYGSASLRDSVLTVRAAGSGIKAAKDHFQYVFQSLIDNGSITTRIDSFDDVSELGQAGLMLREKGAQESPFVMLSVTEKGGIVFAKRDSVTKNVEVLFNVATSLQYPLWLKLVRNDSQFTAYVSTDGVEWTEKASTEWSTQRNLLCGLAVSSGDAAVVSTASFSKSDIDQSNIRPIVQLEQPTVLTDKYIAPANITISGVVYDIDGSIDRTEVYLNDSLYGTVIATNFNYLFKALPVGDYQFQLKSYDKEGAVTSTDPTVLSVKEPTDKFPWYRFDETKTGYFAADANGNYLFGTLFGSPTFVEGKYANSIQLDGVDDYVKLPNSFIHLLSDFTVATWLKPSAVQNWTRVFDFGTGTASYMMLTVDNGSGITFEIRTGSASSRLTATGKRFPLNSWSHIAITVSDDVLSMYLNATLIAKLTGFRHRPYDLDIPTSNYIGKSQFTADPMLKGQLDDFRMFNHALSASEISSIMLGVSAVDPVEEQGWIYPTPARDMIYVRNAAGGRLSIFNASGSLVLNSEITQEIHPQELGSLPPGYYLVLMETLDGERRKHKLIIY